MDFDVLMEYLAELVEFVKPVSNLVSSWFEAMSANISEFDAVKTVVLVIVVILCIVTLFIRLVKD